MSTKRSVVIVGAGPGGLAAALLLAKAGLDVTVVEGKVSVGGRTSTLSKDGSQFDLGPTFFLCPKVLSEIYAVCGYSLNDEVPMTRLDPQYRFVFGSGRSGNHLPCTQGPSGSGVRAMVNTHGSFANILRALQAMHAEYNRPFSVANLAHRAGMSILTFHAHFKHVTATTPVQYVKAIRMYRARALLLDSNATAGSVATDVGYKSASQFGRDYLRFSAKLPRGAQ